MSVRASSKISSWNRRPERYGLTAYAKRKIPFALFVGTEDPYYPLSVVQATRDVLESRGFPVTLKEIAHHDHNYAVNAEKINRLAWEFFEKQELKEDQRYTPYSFENSSATNSTQQPRSDEFSTPVCVCLSRLFPGSRISGREFTYS